MIISIFFSFLLHAADGNKIDTLHWPIYKANSISVLFFFFYCNYLLSLSIYIHLLFMLATLRKVMSDQLLQLWMLHTIGQLSKITTSSLICVLHLFAWAWHQWIYNGCVLVEFAMVHCWYYGILFF